MVEETLQALLATLVSGRCFPLVAPENTAKPYIIYQGVSTLSDNTLTGASGLENKRIQVDCYADTYAAVKALDASIKTAMAGASFTNIHILSQDLYEADTKLFRVSQDFSVWS